jgi:hypothetical protein
MFIYFIDQKLIGQLAHLQKNYYEFIGMLDYHLDQKNLQQLYSLQY